MGHLIPFLLADRRRDHPQARPLLRTLAGHTDAVTAVALTADGRRVVSGSWDNTLKRGIWRRVD